MRRSRPRSAPRVAERPRPRRPKSPQHPTAGPRGQILVLAGVNGAGKSSVLGEAVLQAGGEFVNPDAAARTIREATPSLSVQEANAMAWERGRDQLAHAIATQGFYAFETTLGGTTITALLDQALDAGLDVHMNYVGLANPEQHIARVAARVARGGHAIPDATIRARYDSSREHLIHLLPRLTSLVLYDNSVDAPPEGGEAPAPVKLLSMERGIATMHVQPADVPEWTKPIIAAAQGLL